MTIPQKDSETFAGLDSGRKSVYSTTEQLNNQASRCEIKSNEITIGIDMNSETINK